jgi:urea transport system substrate-binding protein
MANSESTLKDTMLIAEQTKTGGMLGEIQDDGRFQVVWQTDKEVPGDVWSDYLPRSKDIIADWRPSISYGHYDVKTKKCSGKAY